MCAVIDTSAMNIKREKIIDKRLHITIALLCLAAKKIKIHLVLEIKGDY